MKPAAKARVLVRRAWIVLCAVVLGLIVGALFALFSPTTYTATATMFVGAPAARDATGAYQGDLFSRQRAVTYAQLFTSHDLANRVIDRLSLDTSPEALAKSISVEPIPETVLLELSVTDTDPARASDIANAYVDEFGGFGGYVGDLERAVGAEQTNAIVAVVEKAVPPTSPTSPVVWMNLAVGGGAGLLIGLLLTWLRDRFDGAARSSDQVAEKSRALVVGELPHDRARAKSAMRLPRDGSTPFAEAVRKLRTNLRYIDVDKPHKATVVTSAVAGEGTTTIAVSLALAMGEGGRRAVLVDANLRSPGVAHYLGLQADYGLSSVLAGQATAAEAIQTVPYSTLDVLLAGPMVGDPNEAIESEPMETLIAYLREEYEYIVLDAPPLLAVTDAAVLARQADGAIVVSRYGRTKVADLSRVADTLEGVGARLIGAIVTDRP